MRGFVASWFHQLSILWTFLILSPSGGGPANTSIEDTVLGGRNRYTFVPLFLKKRTEK